MTHLFEEIELKLPFWRYCEIFEKSDHVFLLDSSKRAGNLGLFSFLGADPFLIFTAKREMQKFKKTANIRETIFKNEQGYFFPKPVEKKYQGEPIEVLQKLLKKYAPSKDTFQDVPVALKGGAVGYFGYEAGYFMEKLPDLGADDLNLPDIYLGFYDVVLSHDHRSHKSYISIIGRGRNQELATKEALRIREEKLAEIRHFEQRISTIFAFEEADISSNHLPKVNFKSHFDKAEYCELVKQSLDHIERGEAYEICLTHRLESYYEGDGWHLYKNLRAINPAPFSCYLRFPGAEVISSSPERFLKLDENRIAECRPIKGTRPRGASVQEDQQLVFELENSIKDRAENIMIVDLVRNDLGKVCEIGSVNVPDLFVVEKYATVFQLVSTVRGKLKNDLDAFDLLRATFPGGSMTGAPKIEAMKIIDRLEPVKRGIYSGAIGYIDFSGCLDLNIVIRTLVLKNDTCYFSVGGAIVADSDPEAEYDETMDKAAALKRAIQLSRKLQKSAVKS